MSLLSVHQLSMEYQTKYGALRALDKVSLTLEKGQSLGLVGESGCGKSTLIRTILKLLPKNGLITSGHIHFEEQDLTHLPEKSMRAIRLERIALITQSAMNALDPVYKVGNQIVESIRAHRKMSRRQAWVRAEELFTLVGLEPKRLSSYPHQLSGGMKQRSIIAIAMALDPDIIIADEPTTALDVITQDQILRKMRHLQRDRGDSMIYVSHDISVIAETCDQVGVMYAGEIVEFADIDSFFYDAHHPYTMGLQNAFPQIHETPTKLISIPGHPPDLLSPPKGCRFTQRCPFVQSVCHEKRPLLTKIKSGHLVACHFADQAPQFREVAQRPETWHIVAERQYKERMSTEGCV